MKLQEIKKLEEKDGKLFYSGSLDLRGTGITSLPDGLTVGGYLDLRGTGITSLPDGLTVGGYLDLEGTGITSLPDGLTVGGSLDLRGCTGITSLPDGLTVGGYLDLRGTGITSLPDGLTVGGYLDLEGTGITSLPDGLTVGESIYLEGTGITNPEEYKKIDSDNYLFTWQNEKYIKCDGMFMEVIQHKRNVYKARKIGKENIIFIVTDGKGKYSHGASIKDAKEDLIFKISNRDKSEYEGLTLESILTFENAIECYRIITGACSFGTKNFVNSKLERRKSEYSIKEIIELTDGEYGSKTFKEFFI
jgi:hypothetical protein